MDFEENLITERTLVSLSASGIPMIFWKSSRGTENESSSDFSEGMLNGTNAFSEQRPKKRGVAYVFSADDV